MQLAMLCAAALRDWCPAACNEALIMPFSTGEGGGMEDTLNMEEKGIRLLRADEIECRVSTVSEKGASLLLFKDARVDQRILDETFTPFGWRRTHQSIDGNLYCTVEVWDEGKGQWIAKQDVGTMSYTEKEKGQASDSFKRACFNWGIGRELYTAPFIWIPAGKVKIQKKGDKYTTGDRFAVKEIGYNGYREICMLVVVNSGGEVVFAKGMRQEPATVLQQGNAAGLDNSAYEKLQAELERTGITMEAVLARYQIEDVGQMTPELFRKAMAGLKRSKAKSAA